MQINRIIKNHNNLKKVNPNKYTKIFGASKHKFQLNPVATTKQVIEFENKYNFSFPDEYRRFILEVGDGGAGPYYGIKKRFTHIGSTLRHEEAKLYTKPCIYTEISKNSENWKCDLLGRDFQRIEDSDEFLYENGLMSIFEVGCGEEGVIVMNGDYRGKICITDFGHTPYYYIEHQGFLDMYEHWQESILSKYKKWYWF